MFSLNSAMKMCTDFFIYSSRLLLLQEKEQLLRELRGIDHKGRSEDEMVSVRQNIIKLEYDLRHAQEISNRQIQQRLEVIKSNEKNPVKQNIEISLTLVVMSSICSENLHLS